MSHRGTIWIDLTPIDRGPVLCECEIVVGQQGEVDDFQAVIQGLTVEQFNRIFNEGGLSWDEATSGAFEDGRQFEGRIGAITSYVPVGPESMQIEGSLSHFKIMESGRKPPHGWFFYLSNVKLWRADLWSSYPEERRKNLDSIEFTVDGRTWRLTDTWSHKWKDIPKSELTKPILSGRLRTQFREGDTDSELAEVVQDICHVLAIAMSRSVNWVSYALRAADGTGIRGYSRAAWVTGFNKHGFGPVNNHKPFSLKTLLELSLPIIATDREWYSKTLGMLTQAQIADMLDVRCSVLYTLADRISSRLIEKTGQAEIDPGLKSRARKPEFVEELHNVLIKLSPANWTQENTNAVLTEIKRWNKMPTFVAKIQRACKQVRLPEPDKTLLRPRNDLLHDGELTSEDNDNLRHYLELEWVVLTLTLRLFGYEGTYYHPKFGANPALLKDQLVDEASQEKGEA